MPRSGTPEQEEGAPSLKVTRPAWCRVLPSDDDSGIPAETSDIMTQQDREAKRDAPPAWLVPAIRIPYALAGLYEVWNAWVWELVRAAPYPFLSPVGLLLLPAIFFRLESRGWSAITLVLAVCLWWKNLMMVLLIRFAMTPPPGGTASLILKISPGDRAAVIEPLLLLVLLTVQIAAQLYWRSSLKTKRKQLLRDRAAAIMAAHTGS